MSKLKNEIDTYVHWCSLMELKPNLEENICRYNNLCKKLNSPCWQFTAELPNGKIKSYLTRDYPYNKISNILVTALNNGIRVRIFRIDPDNSYHLLHDTKLLEVIEEEEERCFGS